MLIVSAHRGQLQTATDAELGSRKEDTFATGLPAIDSLLPGGGFARGAVHELLAEAEVPMPIFFAGMLARAASGENRWGDEENRWGDGGVERWGEEDGRPITPSPHCPIVSPHTGKMPVPRNAGGPPVLRAVAWSDPRRCLYPPAVAAMGIPLNRLLILHPKDEREELWATAECMRCRGIGATVLSPRRLSRIEARRLQLAAEDGGGIGILLRRAGAPSAEYSAATRWLVAPAAGERATQRWKIQLIHGHGGRIGSSVILEVCRATDHVRAFEAVGGGLLEERKRA